MLFTRIHVAQSQDEKTPSNVQILGPGGRRMRIGCSGVQRRHEVLSVVDREAAEGVPGAHGVPI